MSTNPLRVGIQAGATLLLVVSLYAGPLALASLQGLFYELESTVDEAMWIMEAGSREAVVWMPPVPEVEGEVEGEEGSVPSEEEPEPVASPEPPPDPVLAVVMTGTRGLSITDRQRRRAEVRKRRRALNRARVVRRAKMRQRAQAASRPARVLTDEEKRKRAKRKKREERRAERRQCSELVAQLVEVDEDSWWVGREFINCYRVHPEQFIMMGGAYWNEVKGKKRGLRIHISSRPRGDIARLAGFRRGDVVQSINGIAIRSDVTGALAMTQLLRGKARVKLVRKGETHVLKYKVVNAKKLDEKRLELASLADDDEEAPRRRAR